MVESFGDELKLCQIVVSQRGSFGVVCCHVRLCMTGKSPEKRQDTA